MADDGRHYSPGGIKMADGHNLRGFYSLTSMSDDESESECRRHAGGTYNSSAVTCAASAARYSRICDCRWMNVRQS